MKTSEIHILFIQTGGTIDKDYPKQLGGYAFEFGEPAIHRILERINPAFTYSLDTAFQKDSLEITNSDRQILLNLITTRPQIRIVITHGTDTMIETAKYLASRIHDRTIILTGAMRPERFTNSDAPVNLGAAIAAVQILDPGIYLTMHGIVKPVSEINRDQKTGVFY